MLTYVLALVVVLASLGLYSTTFVIPEVSRKNDLVWSGVGLFYGLVLWVCAGRITGGVLLGQMASVTLMGWMGWQMLEGRWNSVPEAQRVSSGKVAGWRSSLAGLSRSDTAVNLKKQAQEVINKAQEKIQDLGVPVEAAAQSTGNTTSDAATSDAAADLLKRANVPLKPEDFGNPPKAVVDTTVTKPSMKSFSTPVSKNLFGGLFDRAKTLASGLSAPKKVAPKEVYVRKDFRDPSPDTPVTPETAIAIDDDFDFGDSDPDLVESTVVSLSADEMTAMKPTISSALESTALDEGTDRKQN
jgi:hypothetical protein